MHYIILYFAAGDANNFVKNCRGGKTMEEKILTIDEIQTILRIGRNQAYKLVAEKKIRAFRTGKTWKITEKALEDYIKSSENDC